MLRSSVLRSAGLVTLGLTFVLPLVAQEERRANNGNVLLSGVPEVPQWLRDIQRPYQQVRSASVAGWSMDGEAIYITTRFAEVSQLHRVDRPGGARRQMTFMAEPVGGIQRRPGSDELLFRMDEGGGEFYQLFLMDPGQGTHDRLTDGVSRNSSALWSNDGSHLAFTSTRRNGRSNDVWLMDPSDTSSAKMVFQSPDGAWYGVTDFSPDGGHVLVGKYVSVTDSRIHLVNLETGEHHRIAGGDDELGSWLGVGPKFSADGESVFLVTDLESDFRHLAILNLASGERRILTGDIPWDVSALAMSEARTRAAFTTNEGGVSRIYLLDPGSGEYRQVESIPQGIVFRLTFSPDGSQLAFVLNSPQTPSDAFTLALTEDALGSGEVTRWTYSEVGGLDTDEFVAPQLVHYPTFDSIDGAPREIPAFVYTPPGPGPHPVIISIHGGPEGQYRPFFSSTFQVWLHQGAAVIAPNVRGSSGYGKTYVTLDNGYRREDSVKDIGALLDWIATRPDLDAGRVAVIGGSYGGYMVLASAVHYSDRLKAAVDIVGISNFVTFLENTQDYRRDLRRVEYGDERDPAMRAHLESISPNRQADRITVPLLVAQGANDPRVPASESEQIVRDVRDAGGEVWYMLAENEGHGFRKKENRDLYLDLVLLFFETHLFGRDGVS